MIGSDDFESIKALFANSKTFYLIAVNMDSNYAYLNDHYANAFKNCHVELLGKHYSITIHEEDIGICGIVAEECFKHPDQIFPATIRKHNGEGGYIATQWDYKAMFDNNSEPLGIFCIGYDITEFMKNAAALSQLEHMKSHVIRKPIANLMGLIDVIKTMPLSLELTNIVQMLDLSASELDQALRDRSRKSLN